MTPVVLASRPLGLGDLVTGAPALRLLRAALPEHRLVLATSRWLWPLARQAQLADAMVAGLELTSLVDPPQHPELAVDLHGNGVASRRLLEATEPKRLIAYAAGTAAWSADEHEVDRWVRLVRAGLPTDQTAPPLAGALGRPPPARRPALTVIHCGAKAPSRRWAARRFAAVARRLVDEGHDVVITGSRAEAEVAAEIAANAGPGARSATDLGLLELAGVVGAARLVICGDTGVAHLASAYARPSVVLMGPVAPDRWGPPPVPRHQVLWHGDGAGDPHGSTCDPALLRITVDEVCVAARRAEDRDTPPSPGLVDKSAAGGVDWAAARRCNKLRTS